MILRGLFAAMNVQTVAFRNPPLPGNPQHTDAVDDFDDGWRQTEPNVRDGWRRVAAILADTPPGLLIPVRAAPSSTDRVALAYMLRSLAIINGVSGAFAADAVPWEALDDHTQGLWLTTADQLARALPGLGWSLGRP